MQMMTAIAMAAMSVTVTSVGEASELEIVVPGEVVSEVVPNSELAWAVEAGRWRRTRRGSLGPGPRGAVRTATVCPHPALIRSSIRYIRSGE